MTNHRIQMLKEILLELHHGATPESVQERFNQHFSGVSALEISMMEHELMSSDTGITFEDVMALCNVHANLFKGTVAGVDVPDSDQEGHPVYVFKQENLALRATLLRIRRLLEHYPKPENDEMRPELLKGLTHQMGLMGQFDRHYTRKEKLFFPIMERYGHDAPPKVMWGVDDTIRDLFKIAQKALDRLPEGDIQLFIKAFEDFAHEFEEMIFKEEAILLMILLETFTQDDWLAIAEQSDSYGYAIVSPTSVWKPHRETFSAETPVQQQTNQTPHGVQTRHMETPEGQFTITFTPNLQTERFNRESQQPFGNGYLSVEEANLILNHLPLEITFVNKDDIFQYYNDSVPTDEMIFKRSPLQIGRHVDLCHPPKIVEKVKTIIALLRSGERDRVTMWFKSDSLGKFVHVTYAAVRNHAGEFQGVLEYVQDIQEFRDITTDFNREL